MVEGVVKRFDRVDFLILNASVRKETDPVGGDTEEFARTIANDFKTWAAVAKAANIQINNSLGIASSGALANAAGYRLRATLCASWMAWRSRRGVKASPTIRISAIPARRSSATQPSFGTCRPIEMMRSTLSTRISRPLA